jgi:hypothetical protein
MSINAGWFVGKKCRLQTKTAPVVEKKLIGID